MKLQFIGPQVNYHRPCMTPHSAVSCRYLIAWGTESVPILENWGRTISFEDHILELAVQVESEPLQYGAPNLQLSRLFQEDYKNLMVLKDAKIIAFSVSPNTSHHTGWWPRQFLSQRQVWILIELDLEKWASFESTWIWLTTTLSRRHLPLA